MRQIMRLMIIVFVIVMTPIRSYSQTGWTWQNPYPQGNTLYGVFAIDGDIIIAVGEVGTVIRTTNQGTTWSTQSYAGGVSNTLNDVSFADSSNGIAVGLGGVIIRTTDGGITWTQQQSGLITDLNDISYININIATVVGKQSVILRTSDGGSNWFQQGISGSWTFKSVSFVHTDTGVVVGESGAIFQTVDGGSNWFDRSIVFNAPNFSSVSMVNGSIGVSVDDVLGEIHRTTNGGIDWSLQSILGNPLYSVSMTESDTGFATGSNGSIIWTIDGGVSWTSQVSGTTRSLYDISVRSGTIASVVGSNGIILRKSAGFTPWSILSIGSLLNLEGVSFSPAIGSVGTVVGEMGTILRTTNAGVTWLPQTSSTTNDLLDVFMVDLNNGYVVGKGGTIRRTADGGANWNNILSGTAQDLYAGHFISANIGTVVGDNGTIRRTTTGGLNWLNQTTGSLRYMDVEFTDFNNGIVVGTMGSILRTANGGGLWNPQVSNTTATLNGVHFINSTIGTIVGDNGTILRTTNGGLNWLSQASGQTYNLEAVSFSDINTGIVVGDFGIVLGTTNGGELWSRQFSGTMYTLTGVFSRDVNNAFVVGAGNAILRTTTAGLIATSISGIKFHDINADGIRDPSEPGLSGWTIQLLLPQTNAILYSTMTDIAGNYLFSGLNDGTYRIQEVEQSGYIRTYPSFPGYQDVELIGGTPLTEINFGNKLTHRSRVSGLWSNISIWSLGRPPHSDEAAEINTDVIVDRLPVDTILGLKLSNSGRLIFNSGVGPLVVRSHVQIVNGGRLEFPNPGATGIVCYADWENHGEFIAGNSTITMAGDRAKAIDVTAFFNLVIDGDNTKTFDNIIIENQLTLRKTLYTRSQDTIFMQNPAPNSIVDTGRIPQGTIYRQIQTGSIESYRFESPQSYIRFDGSGIYPSSISITAMPNITINSDLQWLVLSGTVSTDSNFVSADSVTDFSKFVLGKPNVGSIGSGVVTRQYTIKQTSGSNFKARLQLRYEQSEVPSGEDESTLRLLRGPVIVDSVSEGWNMVSVPMNVNNYTKVNLFPKAISSAFAYEGGYVARDTLANGVGYWMKFPTQSSYVAVGDERTIDTIDVDSKWNMVGTLSLPIAASNVSSIPPGNIATAFFGYDSKMGYFIADTLLPLRAYWVKVHTSGQLIMNVSGNQILRKKGAHFIDTNKLNSLYLRNASGDQQQLYFGRVQNQSLDLSWYELPPSPPTTTFDVRYASGRLIEMNDDTIPKEFPILVSTMDYPISIGWKVRDPHLQAVLQIGKRIVSLQSEGSLSVPESDVDIILRFKTKSSGILPKEFALYQNYPNPFNPSTIIKFALPNSAIIGLKLYNILGQEIESIIDDKIIQAGYHDVELSMTNYSSGVYIYRIVVKDIKTFREIISVSNKLVFIR